MKKNYSSLILLLHMLVGLLLICVGCGIDSTKQAIIPTLLPEIAEVPKKIDVDVYWDATYSMQGYVTKNGDNIYRTLPDSIEDVGISMGRVSFFRFGENVLPLEGREQRKFSNPNFYTEVITAIHEVVNHADEQHLSIIVTDLFESDADWSNVAQKIKGKYFDKHLSVAVIGIKNPFAGYVFDLGAEGNAKAYYDSSNDPAKYRPFYMMIMGQDKLVNDFVARWQKGKYNGNNEQQIALLSEKLIEYVPTLADMKIIDSENIYGENSLQILDSRMKEFSIDKKENPVNITLEFPYQPLPDIYQLDLSRMKPQIKVGILQNSEWKQAALGNNIINVEIIPKDDLKSLSVKISFLPEQLLQPGTNYIYIALVPDDTSIVLPEWISRWNMDSSVESFDGSKTVNFLRLMESLKNSALSAAKPAIANIVMIINYK